MTRIETIAEGVTLYLGDCREILPALGKVDAVVTDPPYGVGFKYESHNDTPEGYKDWCTGWFGELQQITSGPIAISCGIANITDWPKPNWVFCWHKPASMGRCAVGFNNWEPVLLYGKSRAGQVVDVFRAPIIVNEDVGEHPCPKPIGWGTGIIDRISKAGDTILDPFMGSGTTGVASVMLGRQFSGIEIEPKYFDMACRRIETATKQTDLFIAKPAPVKQEALEL
jgi:DNA modification methylase